MKSWQRHMLEVFSRFVPESCQQPVWRAALQTRRACWQARSLGSRHILRHLPGTSLDIGPPRAELFPVEESAGVEISKVIHPAGTTIGVIDPALVLPGTQSFSEFGRFEPHPPAKIAILENARCFGAHGAVISMADELIGEFSQEMGRAYSPETMSQHSVCLRWKMPPPTRLQGLTVSLLAMSIDNYYHWLFYALPKFALLDAVGIEPADVRHWIVPSPMSRFHAETLDMLGVPAVRRIPCGANGHFQAERLVASSPCFAMGSCPEWVVSFLRKLAGQHQAQTPPFSSRKLYLSRRGASYRRVRNEGQVIASLRERGFEPIQCEQLSVAEQMALFANAQIVVGVHGAAQANAAFCPPGAALVELFAGSYVNSVHATTALAAGLRYGALIDPCTARQEHGILTADLDVDLPSLHRLLDRLD